MSLKDHFYSAFAFVLNLKALIHSHHLQNLASFGTNWRRINDDNFINDSIFKILELLLQNTEHGINHVLALVREDFSFQWIGIIINIV